MSYFTLIMSIGLLVDFNMHILLRYYESPCVTREEKVKDALQTMGSSVVTGGLSTFLGVVPLMLASSSLMTTLFYGFWGMVIIGCAHGVVLLPVVLSYVGPVKTTPVTITTSQASTQVATGVTPVEESPASTHCSSEGTKSVNVVAGGQVESPLPADGDVTKKYLHLSVSDVDESRHETYNGPTSVTTTSQTDGSSDNIPMAKDNISDTTGGMPDLAAQTCCSTSESGTTLTLDSGGQVENPVSASNTASIEHQIVANAPNVNATRQEQCNVPFGGTTPAAVTVKQASRNDDASDDISV
jgi:hypothetical protein